MRDGSQRGQTPGAIPLRANALSAEHQTRNKTGNNAHYPRAFGPKMVNKIQGTCTHIASYPCECIFDSSAPVDGGQRCSETRSPISKAFIFLDTDMDEAIERPSGVARDGSVPWGLKIPCKSSGSWHLWSIGTHHSVTVFQGYGAPVNAKCVAKAIKVPD